MESYKSVIVFCFNHPIKTIHEIEEYIGNSITKAKIYACWYKISGYTKWKKITIDEHKAELALYIHNQEYNYMKNGINMYIKNKIDNNHPIPAELCAFLNPISDITDIDEFDRLIKNKTYLYYYIKELYYNQKISKDYKINLLKILNKHNWQQIKEDIADRLGLITEKNRRKRHR